MAADVPDHDRPLAEQRGSTREQGATTDALPRTYHADGFTLALPEEGWQDQTVFVLAGPTTGDLQHNVTVTVDPEPEIGALRDYGDWQARAMKEELTGCRVLKTDRIELDSGLPAYRAIFRWAPSEERRVYQEQLYVLHEGAGYKLTATFTQKTRKTLGPRFERIMRSFRPAGGVQKQR